jgi:hypothetical protein
VWAALLFVFLLSGHAAREAAKLFSKGDSAPRPAGPSDLITRACAAVRRRELPAAQGTPASGSWRVNTAELARPVSVTERTTGLLGKK